MKFVDNIESCNNVLEYAPYKPTENARVLDLIFDAFEDNPDLQDSFTAHRPRRDHPFSFEASKILYTIMVKDDPAIPRYYSDSSRIFLQAVVSRILDEGGREAYIEKNAAEAGPTRRP